MYISHRHRDCNDRDTRETCKKKYIITITSTIASIKNHFLIDIITKAVVSVKLCHIAKPFPQGLQYGSTRYNNLCECISIKEVIKTFIEAIVLVIIIMYFFLQNFRA